MSEKICDKLGVPVILCVLFLWQCLPVRAAEQPRRPVDFKPESYSTPAELKAKYSDETMRRADEMMRRVKETNENGKWKPTRESLHQHKAPEWFLDAKFGIFYDWGLFSIPAFSPNGYPGWYLNFMDCSAKQYHDRTWGADFKQDDFIQLLLAKEFDAARLAEAAAKAGARYVVPNLKHHDGFCMWDSSFTKRNSVAMGPKRDFAAEWSKALKSRGLKLAFYYSWDDWYYPVLDDNAGIQIRSWHPGLSLKDKADTASYNRRMISGKIPVKDFYGQYSNPVAAEFIEKYDPDIFWGDGEWGINADTRKSWPVMAYFLNRAEGRKEVVFNDRFGGDTRGRHGDFYTPENNYSQTCSFRDRFNSPWETCKGISSLFGYTWKEDGFFSPTTLIVMLVDVVSDGGNLMLIVGLKPQGGMDAQTAERLQEVGAWLKINGEGVYATRKWVRSRDGDQRFTCSKDSKYVYVFATKWPGRSLAVRDLHAVEGSMITMLGTSEPLPWKQNGNDLAIEIPEALEKNRPCNHLWAFKVEAKPSLLIHVKTTVVEPGSTITVVLQKSHAAHEVRYTLDGSTPTQASPLYTTALKVDAPCCLTAALFSDGKALGLSTRQEFTMGARTLILPDVALEKLVPMKAKLASNRKSKEWRNVTSAAARLTINDRHYATGIGLCGGEEICFAIKPEYERFVAQVAIDDSGNAKGAAMVSVYADDRLLAKTAPIKRRQTPVVLDLPLVRGVDGLPPAQLRIVVEDVEGSRNNFVDLVNAGFKVAK